MTNVENLLPPKTIGHFNRKLIECPTGQGRAVSGGFWFVLLGGDSQFSESLALERF
jgi:hypothetical protein